ncbi:hypothetical protein EMO92_03990 [Bifidobacterium reuteri]|uniref:DUF559 domain-containing protein n=1 Tax=Bifidobacterium reuteri TaxID=983706 RepID=A0A5J5E9Y9_9BIFI|nr:hypothetical protein [Bifidobacterium reuteri]KAA8825920.1 hypothetical protein EMO92_03990 [Bifidobacterium reuteri]
MGGADTLSELTELKYQRMKACAEIQQRSGWRPPYALTTALELQAIELPRLSSKCRRLKNTTVVAVSHASQRYRIHGVTPVVWSFPLDEVMVERQFPCTSPVCTWAMFAAYLDLEELIVLADSMMRRNGRLRRTTLDELAAYVNAAESQVRTMQGEGKRARLFPGYENCKRALPLVRSGTDSSMESRTRLVMLKYGLDCPQVNYPIVAGRNRKPVYLDLAYPEFKVCIEYDGSHHAGQWLNDTRRRQAIEDEGWQYVQVTKLDLGDDESEEALARRVARRIEEVVGQHIELTARKTILQVCDGRGLRRKPMHEKLHFTPLLHVGNGDGAVFGAASDELDSVA